MASRTPQRPRVLRVDLARLGAGEAVRADAARAAAARLAPWSDPDPALDRLGRASGSALAHALLHAELAAGRPAPLVVAVGECVRRGLPTAARASVVGRGPLAGRLADGQVGGELGRRLARVADALVLTGRVAAARPGATAWVLVVRAPGAGAGAGPGGVEVELVERPALAGRDPVATRAELDALHPGAAVLRVGPAGEHAVPFAVLASGADPPSFVGRGGLGAVLGAAGLKAVVVDAPPVAPEPDARAAALVRALAGSPRLRARAAGGTLELFDAFAARGDLAARNYAEPVDAEAAARAGALAAGAGSAGGEGKAGPGRERKGCAGCPTPCGIVLEGPERRRQGAHFSALYALGLNLGLAEPADALALLADCDALGVDAREAGAVLALACTAGERGALADGPRWGEREALRRFLADVAARRGAGARFADGATRAATELGLADALVAAGGQAARRETNLAAVLGQCVSGRGADPMRTFAFLVGEGVPAARRARLVAPLALAPAADDPRDPTDKGRLVWWHESLVAAVDATGFCTFSTAGLLADGRCTLDELAAWILPAELGAEGEAGEAEGWGPGGPGRRLLALGASLVTLQREIARRLGAPATERPPAWAAADLARPGMLPEYRRLRGVVAGEGAGSEAWPHLARTSILDVGLAAADLAARAEPEPDGGPRAAADEGPATAPGRVALRGVGPLGRELGRAAEVELGLPAPVAAVLAAAARARPGAARWLLRDGEPVPAVYRDGRRLAPTDPVRAGDRLDLVLAIAGGAPAPARRGRGAATGGEGSTFPGPGPMIRR